VHYRGVRSIPVNWEIVEPEYLSPERVLGRRGDEVSDIYGLGLFLFETLTGGPAFPRISPEERRRAHLVGEVPELTGALAPANDVIQRCLAKDERKRFGSAKEAKRAIELAFRRVTHGAPMPL
jgi:serine/threonine protein kinase